MLIVQIYVADIIFRSMSNSLCIEFVELMNTEFKMSMMGELTFFLRMQIRQSFQGTYICQEKYIKELLNKFKMLDAKVLDTPMSTIA